MLRGNRILDGEVSQVRSANRVEQATTLVKTGVLAQKGIDHVRVLSESKFLGLVRNMVEESLQRHIDSVKPEKPDPASPSSIQAARESALDGVEQAYQKKWEDLRAKHETSLYRVESGMRRLSSTFDSIKDVLARLQQNTAAVEILDCAPPAPPASTAPKQKALLREMLL